MWRIWDSIQISLGDKDRSPQILSVCKAPEMDRVSWGPWTSFCQYSSWVLSDSSSFLSVSVCMLLCVYWVRGEKVWWMSDERQAESCLGRDILTQEVWHVVEIVSQIFLSLSCYLDSKRKKSHNWKPIPIKIVFWTCSCGFLLLKN